MSVLRLAVIGGGNIGQQHIAKLHAGDIKNTELVATCSRSTIPVIEQLPHFGNHQDLINSGIADAVLVATPTANHLAQGLDVLNAGLHLLMEKPLAMSTLQAKQLLAAAQPKQCFAVMLNQRFHPAYKTIKSILDTNKLGQLVRYSWTMTTWYRPNVYYDVSTWRGTWPGEGGGLLINQCIHNIDALQWLVGLPSRVMADVKLGKFHNINVEDEVTAVLSHENGMTGTFVASSGEAPGFNQLQIVGDLGTLTFNGEDIALHTTTTPVSHHCKTTNQMFSQPQFSTELVDVVEEQDDQHIAVLQNFRDAICDDAPLLTPATQGVASIELANAMMLSGLMQKPVPLPLDAQTYETTLQSKIDSHTLRQAKDIEVDINMEDSYR